MALDATGTRRGQGLSRGSLGTCPVPEVARGYPALFWVSLFQGTETGLQFCART